MGARSAIEESDDSVVRPQAREKQAPGRDWLRVQHPEEEESEGRAGPMTLSHLTGAYTTY